VPLASLFISTAAWRTTHGETTISEEEEPGFNLLRNFSPSLSLENASLSCPVPPAAYMFGGGGDAVRVARVRTTLPGRR